MSWDTPPPGSMVASAIELGRKRAAREDRRRGQTTTPTGTGIRLYIAGPMTGYPDFNYPAFHAADARLRAAGYDVLNPAHSEAENTTGNPQTWEWYMRRAFAMLVKADGIALLPGWQDSPGAQLEYALAGTLKMGRRGITAWIDEAPEVRP